MSAEKKIWRVGWRLAVALFLLAFIFHTIFLNEGRFAWSHRETPWEGLSRWQQWRIAWTLGPVELWRTISLVPFRVFALSLALMGLTILIGVARWRRVLRVQGLALPLGRAAGISFVAHFFNSFLLGSTGGDLMKAYYAARETHHKKTEAVVTVLVDRLIGLWAMLLFAGAMMLPNLSLLAHHRRLAILALVILAMLGTCSLVLGVAFWGGVSRRFPRARMLLRRLPRADSLERAVEACRQFGKGKRFLLETLALSMILNAVCVLQLFVISRGLGLNIPARVLFVVVPMIICISALPITPSGLGVRENLFVWMLAVPEINVPATSALSLSLLAYAGSLFWSLVGGAVYLGLKERQHLEEVVAGPAEENG